MERKINAIIQARMGSTRLPGKVLMEIEGMPILGHIIDRLRAIKDIDKIIVATSIKEEDDAIDKYCNNKKILCIRGSESNVLERFGIAAKTYPAEIYIRATGDNPMIDIKLINDMIAFFIEKNLSYTCYKNYPIGSGVELFTNYALDEALEKAEEPYELEHVTPYMYQSMEGKIIDYFVSNVDDSNIRMTVDTESDLLFAKEVFKRLYKNNKLFGISDVKRILKQEASLTALNSEVRQKKLGE